VPSALRSITAPLYLLACLVLGGSAQGVWQNMVLQLAGVAIIAWAGAAPAEEPLSASAKALLLLAMAGILIVALQLIPLPPAIWAHGSRLRIADGYALLGHPVPALPISLTPYASLNAVLGMIPPLAIFCAIVRLRAYRASWLAAALLLGTISGIMLGALQVASAGSGSRWYLYPETNLGFAVGFFANANHMADLLVIALPFAAAIAAAGKSGNIQRNWALAAILTGIVILLVVGIALNGSLAGYALAVPVLAASGLIILPRGSRWRGWLAALAALSVIASVAALAHSSTGGTKIGQEVSGSVQSREEILRTTGKTIANYMPLGSGLGSFLKVYRLYESPDSVTNEYVIHAHNDYAEIILELGLPGIILLLMFIGWWAAACLAVWRKGEGGEWARAASIATAAVLVHSLVDFPLRTAAISSCFAMCLAILADRRAPVRQETQDLRPTRHVVIG
jgi:O-antigen ligase